MTNDYKAIIERLKKESEMVDCTKSQREANRHRIKQLELLNRPKHADGDYVRLDPILERLKDSSYTLNPNKLLK